MEIKVIELKKDLARIAFIGEGHTFMNALVDEILKNPDVDVANYSSEFHFTDPVLLVTQLMRSVMQRSPSQATVPGLLKFWKNPE